MKISALKQILLKKSADNVALNQYISLHKEDHLVTKIIESLEKMARSAKHMGQNANAAIIAFANRLTNRDVEMMRDALGHHVSAHKAELKAGNRVAADQHLNKIVPLMHLMARAAPHSNGKLDIDYVPLEPWETNYTTTERRPETGKLKEGTKGLRRRPSKTDRSTNPRGVPDYRYLEMKPHAGHDDMKTSIHAGKGYPFEEIKVGNSHAIDTDQAYLPIKAMQPTGAFQPHPFDDHPIHNFADMAQDSFSQDHAGRFAQLMDAWAEHGSNKKWSEDIRQAHAADPEGFKSRGKSKPAHHFNEIELLDQPESAKIAASAPQPIPRRGRVGARSQTSIQDHLANLPPELREKFGKQLEQPQQQEPAESTTLEDHFKNLPPELQAAFGGGSSPSAAAGPVEPTDDDIIAAYEAAAPKEKVKMLSQYMEAMKRKHGE